MLARQLEMQVELAASAANAEIHAAERRHLNAEVEASEERVRALQRRARADANVRQNLSKAAADARAARAAATEEYLEARQQLEQAEQGAREAARQHALQTRTLEATHVFANTRFFITMQYMFNISWELLITMPCKSLWEFPVPCNTCSISPTMKC